MIDRIIIENFKSLRRVDLSLGPMNLFIGANASGKSNFLDALRVLQGIGNGFTISEILDAKPKSATSAVWDGIRGGSANACFAGTDGATSDVTIDVHGSTKELVWELLIAFSPATGMVTRERLKAGTLPDTNSEPGLLQSKNEHFTVGTVIYDSEQDPNVAVGHPVLSVRHYPKKPGASIPFERTRPALGQFAGGLFSWQISIANLLTAIEDTNRISQHVAAAGSVTALLANAQRVDPTPALLRNYSQARAVQRMGDHGENFAALIHTLCRDQKTKDAYLSWLRQLRPEEVDDVGVLRGAVDEPLFMLREGGREFPAPVLSDGTLRFAAIAAAFLQPDMPDIMTIEEIENGIHASRLRLLVELLRHEGWCSNTQIMATTHSPVVLTWLREADYKTTFFCKRDESTGESAILPLAEVPHFMDAVKNQRVSDLFAEGWLEAAL